MHALVTQLSAWRQFHFTVQENDRYTLPDKKFRFSMKHLHAKGKLSHFLANPVKIFPPMYLCNFILYDNSYTFTPVTRQRRKKCGKSHPLHLQ